MGRGKKSSIAILVLLGALTFGLVGQIGQQELPAQKEASRVRSLYLNWLDAKCSYQVEPLANRDRLNATAQALEQESDRLKANPDLRKDVGRLIENTNWLANPGWFFNATHVEVTVNIDKSADVALIGFFFHPGGDNACGSSSDGIVTRVMNFTRDRAFFTDWNGNPMGLE